MREEEEGRDAEGDHPLWLRIGMAAIMLAAGAAIGGIAGESWSAAMLGALIASPVAALGFMVPNLLLGILYVLEVFSCAS